MPNFEASVEEVLGLLAKNSIIINRQDKALSDLSDAYNAKVAECDLLKEQVAKLEHDLAGLNLNERIIEGKFDKENVG